MSMNIRYPNITSTKEREQIAQIRSYLIQLVDQLNFALANTTGTGEGSASAAVSGAAQTFEVQGGELSYYELRSLIIKDLENVRMAVDVAVEAAIEEAIESGEFGGATDMFAMSVDEDGNLWMHIEENAKVPSLEIDEDGNMYYLIEG